ncbi:uncharacterized protein (DUF1330 family) [Isoptericola jiangsuensis]|uniref:Uncharacterized protein (DUF1330 family) n=1 Tax=Isoptericola jiangsuensis TaxID=548579 RepID=A0A2A9EYQ8_9MICO|nr:hypothetical protein [Isoptericola jiangsuensis]PFG43289.1 uncharacterized protein (DUF1330 family) [Isoptericola jiangsuensis]
MAITLCVLLWAAEGEGETLAAYESEALTLVPRHGGRVLQRVTNVAHTDDAAHGGVQPTEVQIIEMPDEDALAAYIADPDRVGRVEVRDRAVARTEILRVRPVD